MPIFITLKIKTTVMGLLTIILFLCVPVAGFMIYNHVRKGRKARTKFFEFSLISVFVLSFLLFCMGFMFNSDDYTQAIDPVDGGYTPISSKHAITVIIFTALSIWSLLRLWLRGKAIPPLLLVLHFIFLIIGAVFGIILLIQVSNSTGSQGGGIFIPFPVMYLLLSLTITFKVLLETAREHQDKTYHSKFLNYLNKLLSSATTQPIWILLLLLPVFLIITGILLLLGQDVDSAAKAFTETTTWHFSKHTHPPYLDHRGHYLCTVAACGNPSLVKPLRLGKRHGTSIIVNRQLLIANAFEELIQEKTPWLHKKIRAAYDQYGYPLSRKITRAWAANTTYLLMKPLEYLFLTLLYLCCHKPEQKITKQYSL